MVNFDKLLNNESKPIEIDPIKIFEHLDKESGKEYLRPHQETVLRNWKEKFFEKKDIVVKLHTGLGKTLLGLLMLQSRLNSGQGPAIFLCPDTYLVKQTVREAEAFGIKTVSVPDNTTNLPLEFINSKAILVATCQKLFNGRSVFGVSGSDRSVVPINSLVMDDAHTCIDIIKGSFSITITKKSSQNLYEELWDTFKGTINQQSPGTCIEIENGEDSICAVPFWTWYDKKDRVLEILHKYKDDQTVKFAWNFLKDRLNGATCVFSGSELQISPRLISVDMIPSFTNAKQRIFLSATLNEDTFLIKDLDVSPESVTCPLTLPKITHIGERLILIPALLNNSLGRDLIIRWISKLAARHKECGTVSIVPSSNRSEDWIKYGGQRAYVRNLEEKIREIKDAVNCKTCKNVTVLVNKYDGVDLPDGLCRILCLDSMPSHKSLFERYVYQVRENSSIVSKQIAQRLEQGMGRAIRGISDWCIVILMENKLTNFVLEDRTRKFLSNETKKQIEMAEDLADQMKTESGPVDELEKIIAQVLERSDSWKEYYRIKMDKIQENIPSAAFLEAAKLERIAELHYQQGQFDKASSSIQTIINSLDGNDTGWYLQLMATYLYPADTNIAMEKQASAFYRNIHLHRPEQGSHYNKLDRSTGGRESVILNWIKKHKNHSNLIIDLNSILDDVSFGADTEWFERGIETMGEILGFNSHRPEKKDHMGSDNLWNIDGKQYWLISCKNKVKLDQQYMSKRDVNQLAGHIAWFNKQYDGCTAKPIMIHPSKTLALDAFINNDVQVIRNENLNLLKENIKKFYRSLMQFDMNDISIEEIRIELSKYKLGIYDMASTYLEQAKMSDRHS